MATYRNAREFVEATSENYRALQSYSDVGVVRPRFAPEPLSCWFETDYEAPGKFRFQFIRPHPYPKLRDRLTKYIVGSDGAQAYFYTEQRGAAPVVESEQSLELAVAGATGISEGTAHTIGRLLLDSVGGFSFAMLTRLHFRRSQEFDGVLCRRISGEHGSWGRVTLWFGANDMLLRKRVHHRFRREEARFNIRINHKLPPSRFKIPEAKPNPSLQADRMSAAELAR